MRKEVLADGVVCYLGDCRDVLPWIDRADALITDPPYGLGKLWRGGGGPKGRSDWRFDPKEAKAWDGKTSDALYGALPLVKDIIIWGGNYYALPPARCWLVWDKGHNDTWTTGQAELAWTNLDRPTRVFRLAVCVAHDEMHSKQHPTQKPLSLMTWCLKWTDGKTILDPFMGSGTTGVAAVENGRQFIGIECNETYFNIACKRIAEALIRPNLFVPKPKLVQRRWLELAPKRRSWLEK